MSSIWAVVRHTFAQCLRMKIAAVFLVLLALSLGAMPWMLAGDGTLAGSVRTCLSYSVRITGGLLSVVTVLVTVGVICSDMREKHIFLLAAKPLARWQYLLGRWLGVVVFDAVLLAIASGAIFFMVQHLRAGEANSATDRRAVETEIFTARSEVTPEMPDIETAVAKRLAQLKKQKLYDSVIRDFQAQGNLSPSQARDKLMKQLRSEALSRTEVAGPNGWLEWKFTNIAIAGQSRSGRGRVKQLDKARGVYRIEVPTWLVGQLFHRGPVRLNGAAGRVVSIAPGRFDVAFDQAQQGSATVKDLAKGQDVAILVEPSFQFRYKVSPIGNLSAGRGSLYRWLLFRRADGAVVVSLASDTPVKTATSVTVPAIASLRKGDISVAYGNIPAKATGPRAVAGPANPPVQISHKDVSILYRVGGFNANFVRAMLLIFCQLIFLAALGVFFSCFLSFPVASLACMVLLICGWLMNWLADAVRWASRDGGFDIVGAAGAVVMKLTAAVMPNLSEMAPAEKLVEGIFISWPAVGEVAIMSVALRATFFLALACVIFHKRELAKVQV